MQSVSSSSVASSSTYADHSTPHNTTRTVRFTGGSQSVPGLYLDKLSSLPHRGDVEMPNHLVKHVVIVPDLSAVPGVSNSFASSNEGPAVDPSGKLTDGYKKKAHDEYRSVVTKMMKYQPPAVSHRQLVLRQQFHENVVMQRIGEPALSPKPLYGGFAYDIHDPRAFSQPIRKMVEIYPNLGEELSDRSHRHHQGHSEEGDHHHPHLHDETSSSAPYLTATGLDASHMSSSSSSPHHHVSLVIPPSSSTSLSSASSSLPSSSRLLRKSKSSASSGSSSRASLPRLKKPVSQEDLFRCVLDASLPLDSPARPRINPWDLRDLEGALGYTNTSIMNGSGNGSGRRTQGEASSSSSSSSHAPAGSGGGVGSCQATRKNRTKR